MLTEEKIAALEKKGFKRWTKGNLDRLYINAGQLGLVCTYYKTGAISSAKFNGEDISNRKASSMKCAKTFIDIKSGILYGDNEMLKSEAQKLIDEIK